MGTSIILSITVAPGRWMEINGSINVPGQAVSPSFPFADLDFNSGAFINMVRFARDSSQKLEIVCLDVGQGDAILSHSMGHNILLDGGGNSAFKGKSTNPAAMLWFLFWSIAASRSWTW